jgi:predicted esterase
MGAADLRAAATVVAVRRLRLARGGLLSLTAASQPHGGSLARIQLDAKMPPILAFHGDVDTTVPLAQSLALRDKLIAAGNTCELHIVHGGGHNYGGDRPEWQEKTRALLNDFLRRQHLLP